MKYTLEDILTMIEKEKFHVWYEGRFVSYIGDPEDEAPTKAEVLEDLQKMLPKK